MPRALGIAGSYRGLTAGLTSYVDEGQHCQPRDTLWEALSPPSPQLQEPKLPSLAPLSFPLLETDLRLRLKGFPVETGHQNFFLPTAEVEGRAAPLFFFFFTPALIVGYK